MKEFAGQLPHRVLSFMVTAVSVFIYNLCCAALNILLSKMQIISFSFPLWTNLFAWLSVCVSSFQLTCSSVGSHIWILLTWRRVHPSTYILKSNFIFSSLSFFLPAWMRAIPGSGGVHQSWHRVNHWHREEKLFLCREGLGMSRLCRLFHSQLIAKILCAPLCQDLLRERLSVSVRIYRYLINNGTDNFQSNCLT